MPISPWTFSSYQTGVATLKGYFDQFFMKMFGGTPGVNRPWRWFLLFWGSLVFLICCWIIILPWLCFILSTHGNRLSSDLEVFVHFRMYGVCGLAPGNSNLRLKIFLTSIWIHGHNPQTPNTPTRKCTKLSKPWEPAYTRFLFIILGSFSSLWIIHGKTEFQQIRKYSARYIQQASP